MSARPTTPTQPAPQPRPPSGPGTGSSPSGPKEKNYSVRAEKRFMAKVVQAQNGCWLWGGAIQSRGYGSFGYGLRGRSVLAHRFAYETFVGPIPEDLQIDHACHSRDDKCPGGKCAHRLCVNPAHLELVTQLVNCGRSAPARKTHCINGHEYTDANTIWKRNGSRNCRECSVTWTREWRQKQSAAGGAS